MMKAPVSAVLLLLCMVGYSESARAQEEVQVKPVDIYISGFGGYSFPFKTDYGASGITVKDAELDNSATVGGKLGIWFTAPRKTLGIDVAAEIDVTHFNPDLPGGQILTSNVGLVSLLPLDLNAAFFGINVLARLPMGITPDLPNGRWFPYLGIGVGGQRVTLQATWTTEARNTAPAVQGLGGVKVFLFKHIAEFAEGKFIHASHTFEFQHVGPRELTVNSVHGVGGLSIHF
jgi:hypothetical protein